MLYSAHHRIYVCAEVSKWPGVDRYHTEWRGKRIYRVLASERANAANVVQKHTVHAKRIHFGFRAPAKEYEYGEA